eukprot:11450444-Alexandrium_andersonii.AAC.1
MPPEHPARGVHLVPAPELLVRVMPQQRNQIRSHCRDTEELAGGRAHASRRASAAIGPGQVVCVRRTLSA